MSDWQSKIGGGFAFMEAPFAMHKLDEDRAFELLVQLREAQVRWSEIKPYFEQYLKSKHIEGAQFDKQLERVRVRFEPWIAD